MTFESVETSSKSFIIIINFIAKSIRNQHLIRIFFLCILQSFFGACVCEIKYFVSFQSTLFLKLRASDTERFSAFCSKFCEQVTTGANVFVRK